MKNNDLFYKLASDYNLEFEDGEMTDEEVSNVISAINQQF